MKRNIALMLLVTAVAAAAGCSRAIKEGVGVARGAKGFYAPIDPVAPTDEERPLGEYSRFEIGEFRDDFAGKTPRELFRLLPAEFEKQLVERELPNESGGKTLIARGRVLHYEDSSLLANAISPLEQVIARVELVDADSGRVIGTANCVGRTQESLNSGVQKKAEGLAKAIAEWIADRYPLPPEE
ncbi:MAG: hypothetical protein ACP5HU_02890 [Phycisphaerae bacterium]